MDELCILSLNCWGLYIVSKQRQFRLKAIAEAIHQSAYDIVTLQEVWVQKDFEYIKNINSINLPYAKYFHSGALGSGLVILSKYPIIFTHYHQYTLAGRPLKVFHGDYYVGKGVGSACIEHPIIGTLEVFTTHLHAGYGKLDEYKGHRITESWELANIIRNSIAHNRQVILTGDFNSTPTSHNYLLLKQHAFMVDSWFQMNLDLNLVEPQYTDELDFIQKLGITCNSSLNTWSKYHNKSSFTGDRLDYIFYFQTPQLQCISSSVTFIDYINSDNDQLKSSFSDHFGVKSIFKLMQKNDHYQQQLNDYDNNSNNNMIFPSLLNNPTYTLLSLSTVQALIYILQEEHFKIQQNYKQLLSLFIFLLCSIIILYIIQVVLPYKLYSTANIIIWLLPIFTGLLLIACSALAIICLVVGFVFGFGESQSMYQFILDLQTLLQGIQLRNKRNASLTIDDM
ncbi:Endonuclease/exonuclease/phosphatase [Cunninghamella echinulata]|nr:Endonuclease/exonuclease/phosphatase [Cunninghamella echinulata]